MTFFDWINNTCNGSQSLNEKAFIALGDHLVFWKHWIEIFQVVEGVGVLGLPETPKCFSQHRLVWLKSLPNQTDIWKRLISLSGKTWGEGGRKYSWWQLHHLVAVFSPSQLFLLKDMSYSQCCAHWGSICTVRLNPQELCETGSKTTKSLPCRGQVSRLFQRWRPQGRFWVFVLPFAVLSFKYMTYLPFKW